MPAQIRWTFPVDGGRRRSAVPGGAPTYLNRGVRPRRFRQKVRKVGEWFAGIAREDGAEFLLEVGVARRAAPRTSEAVAIVPRRRRAQAPNTIAIVRPCGAIGHDLAACRPVPALADPTSRVAGGAEAVAAAAIDQIPLDGGLVPRFPTGSEPVDELRADWARPDG